MALFEDKRKKPVSDGQIRASLMNARTMPSTVSERASNAREYGDQERLVYQSPGFPSGRQQPAPQQPQRQSTMVFDDNGPGGKMVRRPNEASAALMQTPRQRPAAGDPDRTVTARGNGFEFSGAAGDAEKFMADTGKGDPVAERNRAIAHQQWLGRQPEERPAYRSTAAASNLMSGVPNMQGSKFGGGNKNKRAIAAALISANAGLARERMQGQNQRANTSMTEGGADRRTNATLRQELLRDTNRFGHEANQQRNTQAFTAGESQIERDWKGQESQTASEQAMRLQRAKANQEAGMKILEAGGDPSVAARTMDNDGVFPVEFGESPLPKKQNPARTYEVKTFERPDGTKETKTIDTRTGQVVENQPQSPPARSADRVKGKRYINARGDTAVWDGTGWLMQE